MLLRDRDEGTARHRFGTARDAVAGEVLGVVRMAGGRPDHGSISRLAGVFDRLHGELDSAYVPDWSGLDALAKLTA